MVKFSRRTVKSLDEFNKIFKNRLINKQIHGFLPIYDDCKNRKDEILEFLKEYNPSRYLIVDDDKSLHGLTENMKAHLVLTELLIGFNEEKLNEANKKLRA